MVLMISTTHKNGSTTCSLLFKLFLNYVVTRFFIMTSKVITLFLVFISEYVSARNVIWNKESVIT